MAFIENEDTKIEGNLFIGSNVKITSLFNIGADAVTITVQDPAGFNQVDEVEMTEISDSEKRLWSYTYQGEETDWYGIYHVFIRATSGDYTSFQGETFELIDGDKYKN